MPQQTQTILSALGGKENIQQVAACLTRLRVLLHNNELLNKQALIDVGIPPKLHQIGVKEENLPALSIDAFNDVCTGGNPRDCTPESILEVYKTAF